MTVAALLLIVAVASMTAVAQVSSAELPNMQLSWPAGTPSMPGQLCSGSYVSKWIVGERAGSGSLGPVADIVLLQGVCSDGTSLPPLASITQPSSVHDDKTDKQLGSPSAGYTCEQLHGVKGVSAVSFLGGFLGVGQQLQAIPSPVDGDLTLSFPCDTVPKGYVVLGYSGSAGTGVDAIQFTLGPLPVPPTPPTAAADLPAAPGAANGTASPLPAPPLANLSDSASVNTTTPEPPAVNTSTTLLPLTPPGQSPTVPTPNPAASAPVGSTQEPRTFTAGWPAAAAAAPAAAQAACCPNNTYVDNWVVGERAASSSMGPVADVVRLQGICSDGSRLPAIAGKTAPSAVHDAMTDPRLASADGYTCGQLQGVRSVWGSSIVGGFLGVGQQLPTLPSPSLGDISLSLACDPIPKGYVVLGYLGTAGINGIDAIHFILGPQPTNTNSATPGTPNQLTGVARQGTPTVTQSAPSFVNPTVQPTTPGFDSAAGSSIFLSAMAPCLVAVVALLSQL